MSLKFCTVAAPWFGADVDLERRADQVVERDRDEDTEDDQEDDEERVRGAPLDVEARAPAGGSVGGTATVSGSGAITVLVIDLFPI